MIGCTGFTQTYNTGCLERYASIAKLNTIRVISSLVNLDWPLQQLDVKNVYLNEGLEEEVHIDVRFVEKFDIRV